MGARVPGDCQLRAVTASIHPTDRCVRGAVPGGVGLCQHRGVQGVAAERLPPLQSGAAERCTQPGPGTAAAPHRPRHQQVTGDGIAGGHGTLSSSEPPPVPSLQELEAFIKEATAGLSKQVQEGDYDGLVEVMGHLLRVKDRQAATDGMFGPLKETIALLSTYGEEMPEEVHQQLQVSGSGCGARCGLMGRAVMQCVMQELPEQWDNTKKLSFRVKQNVAPLQANEVNIIRRKCQQLEVRRRGGWGQTGGSSSPPCTTDTNPSASRRPGSTPSGRSSGKKPLSPTLTQSPTEPSAR